MAEQLQVDWSTAKVSDGRLTVGLSGKPPKPWRATFERAATLLSGGTWEVTLRAQKGVAEVTSIAPDDEARVRQLVEGAVLEANSAIVSQSELYGTEEPEDDEADADDPDTGDETDDVEASPDDEMTSRFQAFAGDGDG